MHTPALLSIQSFVSFGHVGHAAALPPLHALGVEVWPVHTVLFSCHPGWRGWRGAATDPALLAALIEGIDATGHMHRADALLTGYLGDPATGDVVHDALARLRAKRPDARFICDPVLGDDGELYVANAWVQRYRDELVPAADVVTPNAFELETLAQRPIQSLDDAIAAAASLGCPAVVATGLSVASVPEGQLGVLVWTPEARWLIRAPHVPGVYYGTGDAFAALLTAHLLHGRPLHAAAASATSALTHLIQRTREAGQRELAMLGHPWHLDATHPDLTIEPLP